MKKDRNRVSKVTRKESLSLTVLALPGIVLLFIFNYLPMAGVVIAFKDYRPLKGILGSDWCGLDNFKFFFLSQDAVRTIRNTLGYSILFIVAGLFASVTLALMFYNLRSPKMLKFYNTVVILPKFLSVVIISFLVYTILNPSYGLLNSIIVSLGGTKIQWYSEAKYWPVILLVTQIWRTVGMSSVIYYAALMGLDEGLLEAAQLDGANKWHQIIHIMIPHLVPTMVISTILNIGHIFSGDFGLFYQVPKNQGLLYPTTDIINTYVYRALQAGSMAKSTAVGLFQSVAGFIMVVLTNWIVRKVSPENSLF